MNRLEIACHLLQGWNIKAEKENIVSTCHAALEYADILLAIDAQTAKSMEQPANGSVALQPMQHQHTNDIIAMCIWAADVIESEGSVKIEKHTGWGNMVATIAQQRHL